MPHTYRAAVATFTAGGEIVLTCPADATLSDSDLLAAARKEARFAGVDFDSAKIRITEWTDTNATA
jgi:hypothetical protein